MRRQRLNASIATINASRVDRESHEGPRGRLGWHKSRRLLHALFVDKNICIEQRASILGQQVRLFRKLMDGFQNCFLLIVPGSFVIIVNRKQVSQMYHFVIFSALFESWQSRVVFY